MFELFQYGFMVRAFLAGTAIGIIAPLIGIFLVVRRYSLLADTLAHVSLVGVAVGLLTKTQPVIAAIVASVIAAVGIERLRHARKIFGESLLAIFLSGSLAIAAVIMSLGGGLNVSLLSFLFGSITTVTPLDVIVILILGAVVLATIIVLGKELFLVALDEELARASGLPAKTLGTVLVVLGAVTVALSIRIVGVLLIGALMVMPVVSAMQFRKSFRTTILIAVGLSLFSVFSGLFLSYSFNLPSGGTIVVLALLSFVLSVLSRSAR
jgi:zinc transport system permease protein